MTGVLENLTNTKDATPTDGQVLTYDTATSKWGPEDLPPSPSAMTGAVLGATCVWTDLYNVTYNPPVLYFATEVDLTWDTGVLCRVFSTHLLPTPLAALTDYYLIRLDGQHFRLASSYANALAGTAITTGGGGDGTLSLVVTNVAGAAGLVPAPPTARRSGFLRGDGLFRTPETMDGASASVAGVAGLVPAPAAGEQGKFLQGDGTWANVGGTALYARWTGNQASVTTVTKPTAGNDTWSCTKPSGWADYTLYPIIFRSTAAGTMPTGYFDNTPGSVVSLSHTNVYYALHLESGNFLLFDTYAKAVANAGTQWVTSAAGSLTLELSWLPLVKARGVVAVVRKASANQEDSFTSGAYRIILATAATDTNYVRIGMCKPASTTPYYMTTDDAAPESTTECHVETFPYNSTTRGDVASAGLSIFGT